MTPKSEGEQGETARPETQNPGTEYQDETRQADENHEEDVEKVDGDGSAAHSALSKVLSDFVSSGTNATFTCGGSIPLSDVAARVPVDRSGASSAPGGAGPIVLRWDRADGSVAKVQLPVGDEDEGPAKAFRDLVDDCVPAVFGHRGKDVYDENVRRAGALDGSRFSTNLCPYVLGIVDRIVQLLLPNAAGAGPMGNGGTVRAELYKLNVYKGPSGFFKPHVDTPRGAAQFGSLVLCLPSTHTGGRLTVGHAEQEPVAYDWDAAEGAEALQWAAFYSDCKHEVHAVTAGHRVTITYNLYFDPRVTDDDLSSGLATGPAPVDIVKLAPYAVMQGLLENPEWMRDGGVLGIFCAHAYPTTNSKVTDLDTQPGYSRRRSPSPDPLASDKVTTLKGTDMALYAVFRRLGLGVRLAPVITDLECFPKENWDQDEEEDDGQWSRVGTRTGPGMVGKTDWITWDDEDPMEILKAFGEPLKDVQWVAEPRWRDLALIHGNYYGNQAGGPGVGYAYTALLVTIPDAASRQGEVAGAGSAKL